MAKLDAVNREVPNYDLPVSGGSPPVLGYRDPVADAPHLHRTTRTHLAIAWAGTILYLVLTLAFAVPAMSFAVLTFRVSPILLLPALFAALFVLFFASRTWVAMKVIIDHLRAPRHRD